MRARSIALAALSLTASACARPAFDVASIETRTLRAEGDPPMHAIAFPPRGTGHPRHPPLVVVEPILWRRELLLRDGGLVSWLEDEGFAVWLVGADGDPRDARALSAGIVRMTTAIAREAHVDRIDLLATGLGGAAAMLALDPLTAPSSPVRVGHVAFLGAPLDQAYPGGAPATRIAASTLAFHDRSAVGWLGSVAPAEPMEMLPARERFAFVTRLGELPVLFVVGKVDGIAPSESQYPVFKLWGAEAPDRNAVPKGIFLAGKENGLDGDGDAFDLMSGGSVAMGAWERVAGFLSE